MHRGTPVQTVKKSVDRRGIRVTLMGAAQVGKTCIVRRFILNTYPDTYTPTVEDMYRTWIGETELEILDTTGSYEFPAMRDLAIDTSDVFILVFALDDQNSFEYVKFLKDKIRKRRHGFKNIIVVGSKSDEITKSVSFYQTSMIVNIDWELVFHECSAKSNDNIKELFDKVLTL